MSIILAIDDSPSRYGRLFRQCAKEGVTVIVTDSPTYIEMVLGHPALLGVCLDHDMPGQDAREIARDLLGARNFPVIVVSNNTDGAKALMGILDEFEVPNTYMPAGGMDWEDRILAWFMEQRAS